MKVIKLLIGFILSAVVGYVFAWLLGLVGTSAGHWAMGQHSWIVVIVGIICFALILAVMKMLPKVLSYLYNFIPSLFGKCKWNSIIPILCCCWFAYLFLKDVWTASSNQLVDIITGIMVSVVILSLFIAFGTAVYRANK